MSTNFNLEKAHKHSSNHKDELLKSSHCGCFYCRTIYSPKEIEEWVDEGTTAICPKCGIDSVLGAASDFPITLEFLSQMHSRWF